MAKSELIARQSRRPSGWLGEIVGRVMAFDTAQANRVAVEQLALRAGESVLEIGCGHGRTLARVARSPCAFVAGIDPSEVMVRLEENGRTVTGRGADTDTMVASARAYVSALNKLLLKRTRGLHAQAMVS